MKKTWRNRNKTQVHVPNIARYNAVLQDLRSIGLALAGGAILALATNAAPLWQILTLGIGGSTLWLLGIIFTKE
jgi:hypothetical protein